MQLQGAAGITVGISGATVRETPRQRPFKAIALVFVEVLL